MRRWAKAAWIKCGADFGVRGGPSGVVSLLERRVSYGASKAVCRWTGVLAPMVLMGGRPGHARAGCDLSARQLN